MLKLKPLLLSTLLCATAALGGVSLSVQAADVPMVTGLHWNESSETSKKAYLVGVSNFISAEYAYQRKAEVPATDEQSVVPAIYDNIEDLSLEQTVERIDRWYKKNPGKLDTPVLSVIWLDMVEPNL